MTIDAITDNYPDEEFLKADGLDDAIIGVCEDFNAPIRLVYSVKKCLEIMMEQNEYDSEEALDDFMYNVAGGYVGEKTPVWCYDMFE